MYMINIEILFTQLNKNKIVYMAYFLQQTAWYAKISAKDDIIILTTDWKICLYVNTHV